MTINVLSKVSRDNSKVWYYLEWGRASSRISIKHRGVYPENRRVTHLLYCGQWLQQKGQ